MTRLVLVRHGEPDASVRGRCYGRLDPDLSRDGKAQVRRAWRLVSTLSPVRIYASPRRRALQSATLLAARGHEVVVDSRLREIDFGDFEGLTYQEVEKRFGDTYRAWMQRPTEVIFPGGETFRAMTARVRAALRQVRRAHEGQTAMVVSHGGVNRIALADALGIPLRRMFRLDQAYACVNVVDYFGEEPVVRAVNLHANGPC